MDEKERQRKAGELGDAIKESRIEELHELLSTDKGRACINERDDENGMSPLHLAATFAKLERPSSSWWRGELRWILSMNIGGHPSLLQLGMVMIGWQSIS
jgi:hypothetical protein